MASFVSPSQKLAIVPRGVLSPNSDSSRVLKTPLSDGAIWKRLKEAGFDEESIKRRDKAALIAYIAKLEAEIYDHQHHMGLLILERKDWLSKYEEAQSAADASELKFKCAQASHASELANARKREDSLRKAHGIEKECVKNIEKSLHEMRAEYAEVKVAAESKFSEAQNMLEEAQKKLTEAENKVRAAESLEAEASRYHRTAERKLHEVEEREDDLRRRMLSSMSELDAKEKEIQLERQSISERQKTLQNTQERLVDGQALLNQREKFVFAKVQELTRFEKELGDLKLSVEKDSRDLEENKKAMELKESYLSAREEAVIKAECDLLKKEEEVLILQAKHSSKETDKVELVLSSHEATLSVKTAALETDLEMKRKLVEEECNAKRRAWELKELDINQREDFISDREHELEVESRRLQESLKESEERLTFAEKKEKDLLAAKEELELKTNALKQEKHEICQMRLEVQKFSDLVEGKKNHINDAEEKAEAMELETNELLDLEFRLKEEIDTISTEKRELEAEADHLKAEKAKFEVEWELIDEKKIELVKEADRIAQERLALSKFLKDERESLKAEKDAMRDQYKQNLESLSHDREAFMIELERERTEWFSKIQKERADFLLDIEVQKKELENCIEKRREEIENYLIEKEKEFEEEKKKELQHITSLKEGVGKEAEHVNSEMKRLDAERKEISLDREKRDQEWAELNNSIEELKAQREKLEKQRELLRVDREEILIQIDNLKKLEDLKYKLDSVAVNEMYLSNLQSNNAKTYAKRHLKPRNEFVADKIGNMANGFAHDALSGGMKESDKSFSSSPLSAPFSWLKRCADSLLEQRQDSKKRRVNDVTPLGLEEGTPSSTQINSSTSNSEPAAFLPSNHNFPVAAAAETTVYIDKIITIKEVTTTTTTTVDVERVAAGDTKEDEAFFEQKTEKFENNGSPEVVETNGKALEDQAKNWVCTD